MKIRLLIGIALGLALATVAMAADPIIGLWKLNLAKSKFASGQAPKEQTEIYREAGQGQIELNYNSIPSSGASTILKITLPAHGGLNSRSDNAKGYLEMETLITPGEWCMTRTQNGKQVAALHKIVGKEGKTMRQTETGTDDHGKPYQNELFYDRQ